MRAVAKCQPLVIRIKIARRLHRLGIIGAHRRSSVPQRLHQHTTRSLTHVVRFRLERQTPQRNRLALEIAIKIRRDFLKQPLFLPIIDRFNGLH